MMTATLSTTAAMTAKKSLTPDQVAFYRALGFENVSDVIDFLFGQILDLLVRVDADTVQNRLGTGSPDAVDVGKTDLRSLFRR